MQEEDFDELDIERYLDQEREEAIQFFLESCVSAFDEVKLHGLGFLEEADHKEREEVRTALRKTLAVLEMREEYEKCKILSNLMELAFPSFDTTPDREYLRELGLLN